jgi:hypothetical protein
VSLPGVPSSDAVSAPTTWKAKRKRAAKDPDAIARLREQEVAGDHSAGWARATRCSHVWVQHGQGDTAQ